MRWRRALIVLVSAACCALATVAAMAGPANAVTAGTRAPAVTGPAVTGPAAAAAAARAADTQPPAGHLGNAKPVPGLAALNVGGAGEVSAVRCPSPGFCSAAGSYIDGNGHHQAFVANETDFTWGQAIPVPGLAAHGNGGPTDITALSCAEAGSCTVGGWFVDTDGNL